MQFHFSDTDNNVLNFINALKLYSTMENAVSDITESQKEIKQKYLETITSDDPHIKDIGLTFLYTVCNSQADALKTLITSITESSIDALNEKTEGGDV